MIIIKPQHIHWRVKWFTLLRLKTYINKFKILFKYLGSLTSFHIGKNKNKFYTFHNREVHS